MSTDIITRSREAGQKRMADVKQLKSGDEWREYWKTRDQASKFPFGFGDCWKHQFEYVVEDVAAEVGFYVDILGLTPMSIGEEYNMFTSPNEDFHFAFVPASPDKSVTPPRAIRIEFMVDDIVKTSRKFEDDGIVFEKHIRPYSEGSLLYHGEILTPAGITIELWGMVDEATHNSRNDGVH
ncbi:VOC family protein [Calditrichota bacterium]